MPIDSGAGLDPGVGGTYPILGDPSTFGNGSPIGGPSAGRWLGALRRRGGLVNDVMQAANQLGASQAIDLLKGLVMPAITQGVQQGAAGGAPGAALPAAAGALPGAAKALPGAAAALPGAAGALPGAAGALPGAAGALPGAAAGAARRCRRAAGAAGALPGAAAAPVRRAVRALPV